MVVALLLLAAHMHPWEGSGLFLLLLVSIPVDIWALGLCARTVFIDRLKVNPKPGFGLHLWIRWVAFSALALPLIMIVVSAVTETAQSVVSSIVESIKENIFVIPVAEQISLELVMWGSVSSIVLILCILGWLYGLGWLAQPFVRNATPVKGSAVDQASFWDSLRIPSDQPLLLTAFTGAGVVLVFLFWVLLPPTTPHPHEEYVYTFEKKGVVKVEPQKVLKEAEQVLANAELVVSKLQEEKSGDTKTSLEAGEISPKAIPENKTDKRPSVEDGGKP
ncbi:hypothetical protein [Candidatus Nitrospira allomarina]|uniref:Uncharacterized protein n=1 Tax=Candidatus Nitrospira allomarina TaxID=3020900 RepID=A0AA96GKR4_9BACT|nr:hypothetical protein [Candidatus Nitrospira allomarina]WNM59366.1 hypothetical protein PP769_06275 [Candidatus Nitrospira allomarina]